MTEMRTIKLGDQDWKVTPFHCVVGPIEPYHFARLFREYSALVGVRSWIDTPQPFTYVIGRAESAVRALRSAGACLCFTGDPLFANEFALEELTLACIDEGTLIVTNFADLPGAADASKVYVPGEFWLNYAEGGAEKALREGRPRKDTTL